MLSYFATLRWFLNTQFISFHTQLVCLSMFEYDSELDEDGASEHHRTDFRVSDRLSTLELNRLFVPTLHPLLFATILNILNHTQISTVKQCSGPNLEIESSTKLEADEVHEGGQKSEYFSFDSEELKF